MSNNYEQPVEPMSRVEDILRGDTTNVPQSRVEDLLMQLIEQGGGGGGSTVIVTPILSEGTKIASISVNGSVNDIYAPTDTGSEVSISTIQQTGTKIATLTIDDTDYDIYAPEGGSSNLYGTTAPTSEQGSNGDIYIQYTPEGAPAPGEQVTVQGSYCDAVTTQWTAVPKFDTSLYYSILLASTIGGWEAPEMAIADISTDSSNPTWMGDKHNDLFGYVDNNTLYLKTNIWNCTTNNITAKLKLLDYAHINDAYCKLDGEWLKFPGYSEKVLYTAASQTEAPNTLTLSESYKNFDALVFTLGRVADGSNYYEYDRVYLCNELNVGEKIQLITYTEYASYTVTSGTEFTLLNSQNLYIDRVIGIKYGNGGSSSSSLNYSTDEQVVGTWIDGKPLYQRTFQVDQSIHTHTPSWSEKDLGIAVSDYDINMIVKCFLWCVDNNDASTKGCIQPEWTRIANGSIHVSMPQGWNANAKSITLQYTKTTD